jgi:hypothetical protein
LLYLKTRIDGKIFDFQIQRTKRICNLREIENRSILRPLDRARNERFPGKTFRVLKEKGEPEYGEYETFFPRLPTRSHCHLELSRQPEMSLYAYSRAVMAVSYLLPASKWAGTGGTSSRIIRFYGD